MESARRSSVRWKPLSNRTNSIAASSVRRSKPRPHKSNTSTGSNNPSDVDNLLFDSDSLSPPTPLSDTGRRDHRKIEPPAAQSPMGEKTSKDKTNMSSMSPVVQASKPPVRQTLLRSSSTTTGSPVVHNEKQDAEERTDKGKMVVETSNIEATDLLRPLVPLSTSSGSLSNCHLSGLPEAQILNLDEQKRRDKLNGILLSPIMEVILRPNVSVASFSAVYTWYSSGFPALKSNDKEKMVLETLIIKTTDIFRPHMSLPSSSATSGNCHRISGPPVSEIQKINAPKRKDKRKMAQEIIDNEATDPSSTPRASSSAASGSSDRRKIEPPAAQSRKDEKTSKDKTNMSITTPFVQASKPPVRQTLLRSSSTTTGSPAVHNEKQDTEERTDKGKIVLETPNIETTDLLRPPVPFSTSSGSLGNYHLSELPEVQNLNLDVQKRRDKGDGILLSPLMEVTDIPRPNVSLGLSSAVGTWYRSRFPAQKTKDKEKMVLETPIIETTDIFRPHMSLSSSSATSGNRHLLWSPAVQNKKLDAQERKYEGKNALDSLSNETSNSLRLHDSLTSFSDVSGKCHISGPPASEIQKLNAPKSKDKLNMAQEIIDNEATSPSSIPRASSSAASVGLIPGFRMWIFIFLLLSGLEAMSSLPTSKEMVVVATLDGKVTLMDIETRKTFWAIKTHRGIYRSKIVDNTLEICNQVKEISLKSARDIFWETSTLYPTQRVRREISTTVLVVDALIGQVIQSTRLSDVNESNMIANQSSDLFFITRYDFSFWAFSKQNGSVIWKVEISEFEVDDSLGHILHVFRHMEGSAKHVPKSFSRSMMGPFFEQSSPLHLDRDFTGIYDYVPYRIWLVYSFLSIACIISMGFMFVAYRSTPRKPKKKRTKRPKSGVQTENDQARQTNFQNFKLTEIVIGEGRNRPPVVEGEYGKRFVAVKRISQIEYQWSKDWETVTRLSDHNSLLTIYGIVAESDPVHIFLEKGVCNMTEFMKRQLNDPAPSADLWKTNGRPTTVLQHLLTDVLSGIVHLHGNNLVHQNLKPENIIIVFDIFHYAKISDMCIEVDASSVWQAPEQISQGGATIASDMFTFGCLLFFCIRKGISHPFGLEEEQLRNISKDKKINMGEVKYYKEAFDLICQLLNQNELQRPNSFETEKHPMFWFSKKRLEFFKDVNEHFFAAKNRKTAHHLALEKKISVIVPGGEWGTSIDSMVLTNIKNGSYYNTYSTMHLVRLIRNIFIHYNDLDPRIITVIGVCLEEVDDYFIGCFPDLLMETYQVIKLHCSHEIIFAPYF